MADLTYSIKNIFNCENTDGCLHQYDAINFHIPAYQRGYKWGSISDNDPVPVLLNDLWNAFQKDSSQKYYLQYITISKKGNAMEVIDGQQRLTTLSIIISVFCLFLDEFENISSGKHKYAIRPAFLDKYIYPKNELEKFIDLKWLEEGILINGEALNNQDVFYLHQAAVKIYNFINDKNREQIKAFYIFFLNQVMVIVNAVDAHIPGEKVFKNLNSKKIPLTEVDLIKALLLTKVSRNNPNESSNKNFREILEIRSSIGRKWDEISVESNEAAFSSFFFTEGNGFTGLLLLVAAKYGYKPTVKGNDRHYPLFNFYNNHSENARKLFDEVYIFYQILSDWYETPKVYNLLGYIFFCKGNSNDFKFQFIKEYHNKPKDVLIEKLIALRNAKLPDNPNDLKYSEDNNDIQNLLLAINVFPKYNQSNSKHSEVEELKFDFYIYQKLDWTLEHIFPQSPEGKGRVLNHVQKGRVIEMLGGENNIDSDIKAILELQERDDDQKEIYYNALKSIGALNEIGNMALLSHSVNASIGCGFFDEKRSLILKHMQNGKFVPLHTFNVFNKTILNDTPGDLFTWSKEDITTHSAVLSNRINELKNEIA